MQLSQESYRVRWLVLVAVWTAVTLGLGFQTLVIRDYFDIAGRLGLRGAPEPTTPLQQIYPAFGADGQTWVRHAISLTEGNGPQLRRTTIDNAPNGREVHWNSAWAWTIAAAGGVYRSFTGLPLPIAIERASIWLAPGFLIVLMIALSTWVTKRAGLIPGLIIVAAMTCTDRMLEGFFPTYVDHHGLLTVAVFAMMLAAIFMGAGWWRAPTGEGMPLLPVSSQSARSAAVVSALCGACGLWVSAASVIPPIALIGAAGLLVVFVQGRTAQANGAVFDPMVWRIWGRVGAAASVGFYLLEYFPRHMGMRLEPNHPFHAIAWLGGGELIAQLSARWLGAPEARWQKLSSLLWPIAAVAVVPIAIVVGGSKVFLVFDPFMSNLHNRYIQEFLPLWVTLRSFNAKLVFQIVAIDNLPMLAGIATLSYWRRESPIPLWFATFAAVLFNLMGWWQSRWLLNAAGVQIALAIVLLAFWTAPYRLRIRWIAGLAFISVFYLPTGIIRYYGSVHDVRARRVSPKDAYNALYRDIAATLRKTQPTGDIIMLSSPNGSTGVGYYGRFKTLGTLYWENEPGLKAAAKIHAARSEEEAARLIAEHKVTHIALLTEENFITQYYELLHPGATPEESRKCFGWRLLGEKIVPQWLEMIPYKAPDDLATLNIGVMLFKVNFKQTVPEALYNVALSQLELGGMEDAEKTLDILLKQFPQFPQPWLRKGEILIRRHNWTEAAESLLKGISLAPANERPGLYNTAAGTLYNNGQHGLAIGIYRHALAQQPNAEVACYLAWVLATSSNDSIRNAAESLTLAEGALKTDPNSPTYLNTMAAALAENGRMAEAIAAADRAVANSRVLGKAAELQASELNLATLRAGKPIRR